MLCSSCSNKDSCLHFTMSSGGMTWNTPALKKDEGSDWFFHAFKEASDSMSINYEPSVCNGFERSCTCGSGSSWVNCGLTPYCG